MSVDLVPEWTIGDLCLTSYPFGVDAGSTVDIGEPDMVVETATSMLADGDLERVVRYGNRTYVLPFYVMGATLGELAEAEALLRTEIQKTGLTLTHDPGDGFTPASVYEVQTAQLTPERSDDHESHLIRKFTLTLRCGPSARSADPTTVSALVSGSTTVSVDSCDSTTGWSSTRSGAAATVVTWIAGAVGVVELDSLVTSPETWTLTRTGSVDFTATPYLVAEVRTLSNQRGIRVSATANGVDMPVLETRMMTDGDAFHRVTFDARGVGVAPSITFSHTSIAGEPWQGIYVRQVSRTDIAPNVTARQLTRTLWVGGTERTPASIQISPNEATELGLAIVHTYPEDGSGYSPPLRRWRVIGNTVVPDSTRVSGAVENVATSPITWSIPTVSVPSGGYLLQALLKSNTVGTFPLTWQVRANAGAGGSLYFGDTYAKTKDVTFAGTDWILVTLDTLTLPLGLSVAGGVEIDLYRTPVASEVIYIDEGWIFRVDADSALTMVSANGEGFLWLDSPDSANSVPRVWIGGEGDRSNAHHPGGSALIGQGNHVLTPPATTVFTVATEAPLHSVSASYHKRWHSNAAE